MDWAGPEEDTRRDCASSLGKKGKTEGNLEQDGGEGARRHGACHVGRGVKGGCRKGGLEKGGIIISGPIPNEGKRK